jgi:hypothetical protein
VNSIVPRQRTGRASSVGLLSLVLEGYVKEHDFHLAAASVGY